MKTACFAALLFASVLFSAGEASAQGRGYVRIGPIGPSPYYRPRPPVVVVDPLALLGLGYPYGNGFGYAPYGYGNYGYGGYGYGGLGFGLGYAGSGYRAPAYRAPAYRAPSGGGFRGGMGGRSGGGMGGHVGGGHGGGGHR